MKTLLSALFSLASLAAGSFGQTVINTAPYVISAPGTYVLGSDLTYSGTTGAPIAVVTSNVTLDLAGHSIYNPGAPTNNNVGVYVQDAWNVTIQNGIIIGFRIGVQFNRCGNGIAQNLRFLGPRIGLSLFKTSGSIVKNNQMTGEGTSLGIGVDIEGSKGNLVSGNVISSFQVDVFAEGGNYFTENMVSNAAIGFDLSGGPNGDKYRFNTTFNCTASFSGGIPVNSENN
jgi:nitrous oxidase accessory protein NosD